MKGATPDTANTSSPSKHQRPAFLRDAVHPIWNLEEPAPRVSKGRRTHRRVSKGDEDVVADVDHAHPACYPRPSVPNADDPETPRATEVPREAPRALVAARARIKALLDTVRQLEEERGAALLRVGVLEAVVVDDAILARALVGAMPRHAKRAVSCRVLAILLCLTRGARSVNELRDMLGIAQATTSEWLREAVGVGVVTIVVDDVDRRKHVAQLTAKGQVYVRDRRGRGREAGATKP